VRSPATQPGTGEAPAGGGEGEALGWLLLLAEVRVSPILYGARGASQPLCRGVASTERVSPPPHVCIRRQLHEEKHFWKRDADQRENLAKFVLLVGTVLFLTFYDNKLECTVFACLCNICYEV